MTSFYSIALAKYLFSINGFWKIRTFTRDHRIIILVHSTEKLTTSGLDPHVWQSRILLQKHCICTNWFSVTFLTYKFGIQKRCFFVFLFFVFSLKISNYYFFLLCSQRDCCSFWKIWTFTRDHRIIILVHPTEKLTISGLDPHVWQWRIEYIRRNLKNKHDLKRAGVKKMSALVYVYTLIVYLPG
jgi:hypothetical protein